MYLQKLTMAQLNRIPNILIFAGWLLSSALFAQSGAEFYFEQGNSAYRQNDFELAVEWYQKILDTGYESSEIHYNLGNCYYKMDDIGNAVLHFEKARKLNPDDPELQFNLELVNLKVRDRIVMPESFVLLRWWESTKGMFSLAGWTSITAVFYIISMLFGIAYLFVNDGFIRRIFRMVIISAAVLTFCAGALLAVNIMDESQKEAIVLTSTVNVLSAPEENSTNVFLLHEGAKVTMAETRGEWVKIALPDGKSGWLKQQYLGVI